MSFDSSILGPEYEVVQYRNLFLVKTVAYGRETVSNVREDDGFRRWTAVLVFDHDGHRLLPDRELRDFNDARGYISGGNPLNDA